MWEYQPEIAERWLGFNLERIQIYPLSLSKLMRLFRLSVRGAFFLRTTLSVCALTNIERSASFKVQHSLQIAWARLIKGSILKAALA
jgi:hypothetical protein